MPVATKGDAVLETSHPGLQKATVSHRRACAWWLISGLRCYSIARGAIHQGRFAHRFRIENVRIRGGISPVLCLLFLRGVSLAE
jgi:hypothetical protein